MKTTIPLYLIAIGIACIGLQNAGIIRPYKLPETRIDGPVEATINDPVEVNGGTFGNLKLGIRPIEVEVKNFYDLSLDR
jgi:hypothetical protein